MKDKNKITSITHKQKEIILYLYKFRFLTTNQIQQLLNHKNSTRINEWLIDLLQKNMIKRVVASKSFYDKSKPLIYFLGPSARTILKQELQLGSESLEYIYSEKRRDTKFIEHCLFLADVYKYLQEDKKELQFFTKNQLRDYEYFPQPIPDAFIAIKGKDSTRRYFLDLFDEYTPPFALRNRVRMYLDYVENSSWDENTDYAPFPSILFICPTENMKKHIQKYAKALLEKTFEDKISLFLTTKLQFKTNGNNIWQKVE